MVVVGVGGGWINGFHSQSLVWLFHVGGDDDGSSVHRRDEGKNMYLYV
jgi:hypothetical protein